MKNTSSKISRVAPVHFSGHETFPLRQMWLKKAFDQATHEGRIPKTTFTNESSIAAFGVGKNMVSSIRHWALASGVMDDEGDTFRITSLAMEVLQDGGLDPYAEDPATAWLVHWQLAGRRHRSTTWYWLYNHVTAPTFTRQELEEPLAEYARSLDPSRRLEVGLDHACLHPFISCLKHRVIVSLGNGAIKRAVCFNKLPGGALQHCPTCNVTVDSEVGLPFQDGFLYRQSIGLLSD
ncbi:DUF4007 family protein [Pseudomonas sp. DC3000-4b1]|uniref:DUF4007 family protein n=1 Tax=unclassified Pseudomonas TaxID=196821 RepID=UPI003CF07A3A